MAGKHNANRQAEQAQYAQDQDDRISNLEAQQQQPSYQQAPPAPQPPPAPAAAPSPMIDQLNQLATLHQQGILSDEEFAAAKAKLLGT
jgi:hypothetical protein